MVLIAAAGNAGPKSPPLFPAADPNVIAVTATDTDDAVFTGANRGDYIAVGGARGRYSRARRPTGPINSPPERRWRPPRFSGVWPCLIERNPSLTPADVRRILMSTAKDLGPKGKDRDFGAGLVNALEAVRAATAAKPAARQTARGAQAGCNVVQVHADVTCDKIGRSAMRRAATFSPRRML